MIRPYVMEPADRPERSPAQTGRLPLPRSHREPGRPDPSDLGLFATASGPGPELGPMGPPGPGPGSMGPGAVGPPGPPPGVDDGPDGEEGSGHRPPQRGRHRRRRPAAAVLAAAVGAVVVVVAGAVLAAGLFTGDGEDDRSAPDQDRVTAVPTADGEGSPAESEEGGKESASPSKDEDKKGDAGPRPSASASDSPSASPARSSEAPSPTRTSTPAPPPGPTLSRGDSGGEVRELQRRLTAAGYYDGPVNATYEVKTENAVAAYQNEEGISGDGSGVYGPATRRSLEGAT